VARGYRHEDVASVPSGWKVRTVVSAGHRVRIAFPPGRRQKRSGRVVEILHPREENPCRANNPSELLLMGANPMRRKNTGVYDSLSRNEKLALGRLGIGKRQIQTQADLGRARNMVEEARRLRNRLPNPSALDSVDAPEASQARELFEEFHESPSEHYTVRDEPHMPAGDYTDLGSLIALGVKPQPGGETQQVQEIVFPREIRVVSDPAGTQLYLVGEQPLEAWELKLFGAELENRTKVGVLRHIAYQAVKWHPQVPDGARGKNKPYEHKFGDEGGAPPDLYYDRELRRCFIEGGTYSVVGVGIKN
jgi:hypothetical protein